MSNNKQIKKEKMTKKEFFFELPLYTPVEGDNLKYDLFEGDVDAYSPKGFDTTYKIELENMPVYTFHRENHLSKFSDYYAVSLTCKRKGNILRFFIFIDDSIIVKIGQDPSLADMQYAIIGKKYDKILSSQDLHDFKKAIGLMAHGAGAGSLVYLRRIFENIILETYQENKEKFTNMNLSDFKQKRMDEKVTLLRKYLPSELVEMKKIYGILSKGIHELSEDECLTYFPALRLSIELILDQKIEEKNEKQKNTKIKSALNEISQLVKNK